MYADAARIRVTAAAGKGVLRFTSLTSPRSDAGTIVRVGEHRYELALAPGTSYVVERDPVERDPVR